MRRLAFVRPVNNLLPATHAPLNPEAVVLAVCICPHVQRRRRRGGSVSSSILRLPLILHPVSRFLFIAQLLMSTSGPKNLRVSVLQYICLRHP